MFVRKEWKDKLYFIFNKCNLYPVLFSYFEFFFSNLFLIIFDHHLSNIGTNAAGRITRGSFIIAMDIGEYNLYIVGTDILDP